MRPRGFFLFEHLFLYPDVEIPLMDNEKYDKYHTKYVCFVYADTLIFLFLQKRNHASVFL